MKKNIFCIVFVVIFVLPVFAQKLKSEANGYFNKKDYCKAVETYEKSIAADESMDNYSYYHAAQSACQCRNQTEKAINFYQEGFKIAIDATNYDYFANDSLNSCFSQTTEWKKVLVDMKIKHGANELKISKHIEGLLDTTKKVNQSALTDKNYLEKLAQTQNVKTLVKSLGNFNDFPNAPVTNRWVLYYYKVNDSLEMPYLVYIPKNYNPKEKTPLYIYLHGAARRTFLAIRDVGLTEREASFLDQPINQNAFIIYACATKDFNWLLHQKAFESIIGELRQVKSLYNIDDNRVYITGHSNGGSGVFWFAVNMPTEIASFAGISYNPVPYFGNANLSNLKNGYTFFGLSATDDGFFDFKKVNPIAETAKNQGLNWINYTIEGVHEFPYKHPEKLNFIYDILKKQQRNPYPTKLQWETDNAQNGRLYWLEISKLDTDRAKESWQVPIEPTSATVEPRYPTNFYRNKSGAFIAEIGNNIVKIKASRVKELTFYVVPQLVNLNKPLKIYVNDKLLFNAKVKADKNILLEEFIKTKDRELLVINKIKLEINQ